MPSSASSSLDVLVIQSEPGATETCRVAEAKGLTARALVPMEEGPPSDLAPLHRALQNLSQVDAVVVGSFRALRAAAQIAGDLELEPCLAPVYCVGASTARKVRADPRLRSFFSGPVRGAPVPRAEGLFEALAADLALPKATVFFPRTPDGRTWLMERLVAEGVQLWAPDAYRMVDAALGEEWVRGWVARARTAAIFSGEGFRRVVQAHPEGASGFSRVRLFAIGPVAAERIRSYGLTVTGVAQDADAASVLDAVQTHLES